MSLDILLVDHQRIVADAMRALILDQAEQFGDDVNVSCSQDCATALELVAKQHKPFDLIVSELVLPGANGLAFLDAVRAHNIPTPVVLCSAISDPRIINSAREKGAAGYLHKSIPGPRFLITLKRIAQGEKVYMGYFAPDTQDSPRVLEPVNGDQDTPMAPLRNMVSPLRDLPGPKQVAVLRCVVAGMRNKEIGQQLNIAEATVKYHVARLFECFEVRTRTALVARTRELGLLDRLLSPSNSDSDSTLTSR